MKSDLEKNLTEPTSEQTLVNLVQSMVAPDSWEDTGQGLGAIDAVDGILIVSQAEKVHHQIEKLLGDLEANVLGRTRVDAGPDGVGSKPKVGATSQKSRALKKQPSNNPGNASSDPFAPRSGTSDPFATPSDRQADRDPF